MGMISGMGKYMLFTPLTLVGFVCMYIFGGTVDTLLNTWQYLFKGEFINAALEYFVISALPPTSWQQIIGQVFLGTVIAGIFWFFGTLAYHVGQGHSVSF